MNHQNNTHTLFDPDATQPKRCVDCNTTRKNLCEFDADVANGIKKRRPADPKRASTASTPPPHPSRSDMTSEQRTVLRQLIDARRRQLIHAEADGIHHGTENAYKRHRCRCNDCRHAATTARRNRKRNPPNYQYRHTT